MNLKSVMPTKKFIQGLNSMTCYNTFIACNSIHIYSGCLFLLSIKGGHVGVVDGGAGLGLVSVLHRDLNEIKRN